MMEKNSSGAASRPPAASQDRVRRATLDDVPRLALVAMSGFYEAPQFAWERPYHHQYPQDTYLSYVDLLRERIADPGCLCCLVEDSYDATESAKTGATIATGDLYREPLASDLVPVGVSLWNLPEDSQYRLLPSPDPQSTIPPTTDTPNPTRDVHTAHRAQLRAKVSALKSQLFTDDDREKAYAMIMFAVHPAYQGSGLGGLLLGFGAKCADAEGRVTTLFSQPKAVPLYERAGFEVLEWAFVEDEDGEGGGRFDFAAMRRGVSGRDGVVGAVG